MIVVPIFAPMIIGTATPSGTWPDPTSPTTVAVVTDEAVVVGRVAHSQVNRMHGAPGAAGHPSVVSTALILFHTLDLLKLLHTAPVSAQLVIEAVAAAAQQVGHHALDVHDVLGLVDDLLMLQ